MLFLSTEYPSRFSLVPNSHRPKLLGTSYIPSSGCGNKSKQVRTLYISHPDYLVKIKYNSSNLECTPAHTHTNCHKYGKPIVWRICSTASLEKILSLSLNIFFYYSKKKKIGSKILCRSELFFFSNVLFLIIFAETLAVCTQVGNPAVFTIKEINTSLLWEILVGILPEW